MSIWNEMTTGGGSDFVFNGGKAGDCVCDVTVKYIKGGNGPKGNPLPESFLYKVELQDSSRPESKPLEYIVQEMNEAIVNAVSTDKTNFFLRKLNMLTAKHLFEAMCPGVDVPSEGTPDQIVNTIYDMCVKAGTVSCRVFVDYSSKGKPHSYLNWNPSIDCNVVAATNIEFKFKESNFMTRPKSDTEPVSGSEETVTNLF
jgi:hypothetical protein